MKGFKPSIFLATMGMCLIFLLSACKDQSHVSTNNKAVQSEEKASITNEAHVENNEEVVWDEVTEKGVNEALLLKNTDEKTLTYIAKELQGLCDEI